MNTILAIEAKKVPKATGPYSQGLIVQGITSQIFVSGQLPLDYETGALMAGDISLMTERILENIQSILLAAGSSLEKVVRVEIFCIDIKKDFPAINAVYGRYFSGAVKPARQSIQVAALPLGSPLEISCIAVV